ncbi:MAG: hypothetical protein H0W72_05125 [Planctomycetes bacterium]|nr:hypothetical protein [Planctomycetota bacterium]
MPTPSSDYLKLGSGECFIRLIEAGVLADEWRHLGNVETLEVTTTDDKLVKKESMTRARAVYKSVTRSRDIIIRLVGDEFSPENLALMMMGSVAYATQTAVAVVDQVLMADVPASTLGAALGGQFFYVGALGINTVTLKLGATSLGASDFEVYDPAMGLIRVLEGSAEVTDGAKDLLVSYTPTAITGKNSPVVRGGTETEIEAQFMFMSDNTAGENAILRAWRVSISPDGALGWISDEFAQFALNLAVQSDADGNYGGSAADPLYHAQFLPNTLIPA